MGTGKSSTSRLMLRVTGGMLQILINVVFYAILVYFVIQAARGAYDLAYQVFGSVSLDPPGYGREISILIEPEESSRSVAAKLELNQVIVNEYSFLIRLMIQGTDIEPGEHILNSSWDYGEILTELAREVQTDGA